VRHAILVVVLVTASFLGGAFVNGPGLQWAQTKVLRSLGLNNGGEISLVDLKPAASSESGPDGSESPQPDAGAMQGPLAPMPSLLTEDKSPKHDVSDRHSVSQTATKTNSSGLGSPRSEPSSFSSSSTKRRPVLATSSAGEPAPKDPNVAPASAQPPPPPHGASSRLDPNVAPAILDSLAALLPSNSPSLGSHLSSSSPTALSLASVPRSVADGNENWAVLERKLQSQGVNRFTMEGEPGRRVVFSCLIPLAGRQAVAQRFEAEGDDIVQAAQAALRRIALWRATQPPSQ
jgi:hypothetical protein